MPKGSTLRASWIAAAIILVVAAEARFLGLAIHSLWFDEAFSVDLATKPVWAVLRFLPYHDTHPPLYYVLLGGWIHIFGSSETAVRSLSALAGFLMVPLLYAFARRLMDRDVALVAAALLAGSAFATAAAQEARMYPLLGLLALASWYSLRLGVQHRTSWPWIAYAVSSALMLYTHYFGFLVIGSQVLYLIPLVRRDRRTLTAAALSLGIVALLFVPWVHGFVLQATSGRAEPTFRQPAGLRAVQDLLAQYGFGGELLGTGGYQHVGVVPLWKESLIVLPFFVLVVIGAYAMRGERAWCLLCYLVGPVAMALVVSLRDNIFYPRYFSFLEPPFALLVAAGIDVVASRISRLGYLRARGHPTVMAGFVAIVLLANGPVLNGYRWHRAGDYDWRGAAAIVSRTAGANDYLLFIPGFARIPFEYYYKGNLGRYELTPVETYQMARMKTSPVPSVDKAWARSIAEVHPRIWIVTTVPMTPASFLRLEDLLNDSFLPVNEWDFNNVYVFSLTSRLYAGAASSR